MGDLRLKRVPDADEYGASGSMLGGPLQADHRGGGDRRQVSFGRRLRPPVTTVEIVHRDEIVRTLEAASGGGLTLLVAPPGYGKTVALSQFWEGWRRAGEPVAWLGLSEAERDPARFLAMLASALRDAGVRLDDAYAPSGPTPHAALLSAILTGLGKAGSRVAIVIDQLEKAATPAVEQVLRDLIQGLPDTVRLILASRRRPSLAIAAMGARGAARIVGPDELRFSEREIAQVVAGDSSQTKLTHLAERTEGWPVAVQLCRSWKVRPGVSAFASLRGAREDELAAYVAEQVLSDLSDAQLEMLQCLSMASPAEPALLDYIRQRDDSAAALGDLARALPGLVERIPGPQAQTAYRVHPVLASCAEHPGPVSPRVPAVDHGRAAEWYWRRQRYREWMRHASASGDEAGYRKRLTQLPCLEIYLSRGDGELRAILREAPKALLKSAPPLRIGVILCHFNGGYLIEARRMLEELRAELEDLAEPAAAMEAAALDLLFGLHLDDDRSGAAERLAAFRHLATANPIIWAWFDNLVGIARLAAGDLAAARLAARRCRGAYGAWGGLQVAELHLAVLDLQIAIAQGDLNAALRLASAAIAYPAAQQPDGPPFGALGRIARAIVQYERTYALRWADELAVAAERFAEAGAGLDVRALAYPVLVDAVLRRDGPAAASMETARLRSEAATSGERARDGLLDGLDALVAPDDRPHDDGRADPDRVAGWRERDLMRRAGVLQALGRGEPDRARQLACELRADGRSGGRIRTEIKGCILEAMALDLEGHGEAADVSLRTAVQLALPSGMLAVFAEEGAVLRPLLERVANGLSAGLEQRHCVATLKAMRSEPRFGEANALSPRELEILLQLAEGATYKRIARNLGLSNNTVKFHLKKAYAKLGATSRKAAVAKVLQQP